MQAGDRAGTQAVALSASPCSFPLRLQNTKARPELRTRARVISAQPGSDRHAADCFFPAKGKKAKPGPWSPYSPAPGSHWDNTPGSTVFRLSCLSTPHLAPTGGPPTPPPEHRWPPGQASPQGHPCCSQPPATAPVPPPPPERQPTPQPVITGAGHRCHVSVPSAGQAGWAPVICWLQATPPPQEAPLRPQPLLSAPEPPSFPGPLNKLSWTPGEGG